MLWILMAMLVLLAGAAAVRRRHVGPRVEDEPWRASLGEDEPLDVDEIRRAEEDWLREADAEDGLGEEDWR
jgi:hypothetical protein